MVHRLLQQRNIIIDKIVNSLIKVKAKGLELDREALIREVMGHYGSSRRVTIEYILAAEARFHAIEMNVQGDKIVAESILEDSKVTDEQGQ